MGDIPSGHHPAALLALGKAREALEVLAASDEGDSRLHAVALWNAGSAQEAVAMLERRLQSQSDDPQDRHTLAWMRLQLGDAEAAAGEAAEGLSLRPEDPSLLALHAAASLSAGQLDTAAAATESLSALRPDAPQVAELRAHVALRRRDWKGASAAAAVARQAGGAEGPMFIIESLATERSRDRVQAATLAHELMQHEPTNRLASARLVRVVSRQLGTGLILPAVLAAAGGVVLALRPWIGEDARLGGFGVLVGLLLAASAAQRQSALPGPVLADTRKAVRARQIQSMAWGLGAYMLVMGGLFSLHVITADVRPTGRVPPTPWFVFVVPLIAPVLVLLRLNVGLGRRRTRALDSLLTEV